MTKKEHEINKIKQIDTKYMNDDQKNIAIKILENTPEKEISAVADFIYYKKKTGFVFDYSPEIAQGRLITLKEDKQKRINVLEKITEDENKLISGDNYNALKALEITHKEKINIIYIDPPYNTEAAKNDGNQSSKEGSSSKFIYKDKFGRGGWLNMMKTRLNLAKNLLSKDGVIFVSIDDSEQAYLKVLMDDIFGEENFVSNLIWIKKLGPGGNTSFNYKIVSNTEYILVYSKNIKNTNFSYHIHDESKLKKLGYLNKDKYFNERGYYKTTFLYHPSSTGSFQYSKSLDYQIEAPNKEKFTLHVNLVKPKSGCYTWSYESYLEGNKLGFIEIKKDSKNNWVALRKQYQYVKFNPKTKKIEKILAGQPYTNLIDKIYSSNGGSEIISIFNNKNTFDFPKPVSLIKWIIKLIDNKNALILDFFAGSGTTGQAVLELNREDNGNRKFILVTNNENNIAKKITYERLYRIIKGKGTNNETFAWSEKNKPFFNAKLRTIIIDDSVKISLNEKISETIDEECKKGLQLLGPNYNKENLDLYYDLAALNPLEKE